MISLSKILATTYDFEYVDFFSNQRVANAYDLDSQFNLFYEFLDSIDTSVNVLESILENAINQGGEEIPSEGFVISNGDGTVKIVSVLTTSAPVLNLKKLNFTGQDGYLFVKDGRIKVIDNDVPYIKVTSDKDGNIDITTVSKIDNNLVSQPEYELKDKQIEFDMLSVDLKSQLIDIVVSNAIEPPNDPSTVNYIFDTGVLFKKLDGSSSLIDVSTPPSSYINIDKYFVGLSLDKYNEIYGTGKTLGNSNYIGNKSQIDFDVGGYVRFDKLGQTRITWGNRINLSKYPINDIDFATLSRCHLEKPLQPSKRVLNIDRPNLYKVSESLEGFNTDNLFLEDSIGFECFGEAFYKHFRENN